MTDTIKPTAPKSPQKHEAKPPFRASQEFADNLQRLHVDLIDLHLQAKQAHWNVVGKNFRDTHLVLDLITAALYATAGTARDIHEVIDAADPTTADIIHTVLERLEQLAWMIDAENRIANRSIPRPVHE